MSDSSEATCCGRHADEKRAATDPASRRALWIVLLLSLGFWLVEIVGGFPARS
jgi:Co/Zn/Cd efflux system component